MNCGPSESTPEDEKHRPYICPCGKGYLSYPALFTHIKQKHDGKPPGNIIRPKSQNKRGRPRKMQLGETGGQCGNERAEFKSFASRMLFGNEEEEKDIGYLISQVESAKQRFKASLDFVPPITSSHLAILCPTAPHPASPLPSSIIQIREELLDALEGARGSSCASAGKIEQLISLNVPYMLSIQKLHRSVRRPLGSDLWQMEIRTALLEFLDGLRQSLERPEFRNVEVLLALFLYFLEREVAEEAGVTTCNYVQYLNTFVSSFVRPLSRNSPYNRIFSLRNDKASRILMAVHRWLVNEGLADFVVQLCQEKRSDSMGVGIAISKQEQLSEQSENFS